MDVESPCKKECLYDSSLGFCVSCGRTLDDLNKWVSLSKKARKERTTKAEKRLLNLRKEGLLF